MNKYIYILYISYILVSIPMGSADIVAKTSGQYNAAGDMTTWMNSVSTEAIVKIPPEVLIGTDVLSGIRFACSKDFTNPPNSSLILRFVKFNSVSYTVLDNSYILPSQCIDSPYFITWNFYQSIPVTANDSYGLGMYSTETGLGTWEYLYLDDSFSNGYNGTAYSWLDVVASTPIVNVSVVDVGNNPYTLGGSAIHNFPFILVYGTISGPTPTPAPTSTYYPPHTQGGIDEAYTGLNSTYNSSINGTYSTIPNGTGFDDLLKGEGLCTTGTCHMSDMTDFLSENIYDLWLLTLGLVVWRFWRD